MQTLLLVRALIELGFEVEVCCYFESDEQVVKEFQDTGALVTMPGWSRSIGAVTFINRLTRFFRKHSPSVVHVQYMAPGLLPILAAKLARVPVVMATVHQPGTPYGLKAHFFLRFAARLTDRFTCVSEAAEKSWFGNAYPLDPDHPEKTNIRKHFTIPNSVDLSRIDSALERESNFILRLKTALAGKRIIGAVGRLTLEKGIDILLRAFAEAKGSLPGMHLLIIGDGVERSSLSSLADRLGIADCVTWTGTLRWEDAIGCMGLMEVVAVPSRFEGFGLTAAEAMACGKPVVASRVDGLENVIQDGETGYLKPTGDSRAFSQAILKLMNDGELRSKMGKAGKRRLAAYYSYSNFQNSIRTLYGFWPGSKYAD